MDLFIIFRLVSVILGLAIGFFSFRIYQITKGSSAWFYMVLGGTFLCIWACLQSIFILWFPEMRILTILSSLICFSVISYVVPIAIVKLNNSFGISLPKFFSEKSITVLYIVFWLVLLVINLIMPFANLLMELAGIAHLMMTIMLIIIIYPTYLLWKKTKVWIWMLLLLFVIIGAFSIGMGAYKGGCCNDHKLDSGSVCDTIKMDYSETIPLPCNSTAVSISALDSIPLTISVLLVVVAFYGMWRRLKA